MIFLLAQSTPDPVQLAGFLGCIAFLVGIAVGIKKLVQRTPTLGDEFVTRREFEALETRLDEKIDGLTSKLTENNNAGEARVILLHERINKLPSEIITLLRATKNLLE